MKLMLILSSLFLLTQCKSSQDAENVSYTASSSSETLDLPLFSVDQYSDRSDISPDSKARYLGELSGTLDLDKEPVNYIKLYEEVKSSKGNVTGHLFLLNAIRNDPQTVFRQLRTYKPVVEMPEIGFTLVTKNVDVRAMLHKPHVYSVSEYSFRMEPAIFPYMLSRDTPPKSGISSISQYSGEDAWQTSVYNTLEKKIMRQLIPKSDYARFQQIASDATKAAIDGVKVSGANTFDVVTEVGRHVPIRLIQDYFGFDASTTELKSWSYRHQESYFHNASFTPLHLKKLNLNFDEFRNLTVANVYENTAKMYIDKLESIYNKTASVVTDEKTLQGLKVHIAGIAAGIEMKEALAKQIRSSGGIKSGTVFDKLLARQDSFKEILGQTAANESKDPIDRIAMHMIGGLVGANETSNQAVTHSLNQILTKPGILEKAVQLAKSTSETESIHGTDFSKLVWEALRFHPINPFVVRVVSENASETERTVSGTVIPAGTRVLIATASAMLDPMTVWDPESFKLERNRYDRDMNLGYSLHRCLGDNVALVMVPEMMRQILVLPGLSKVVSKSPDPAAETLGLDYGQMGAWPVSSLNSSDNTCETCVFGKNYPVLRAGSFPQSLHVGFSR